MLSALLLPLFISAGLFAAADAPPPPGDLRAEADASVARAADPAVKDPLRPIYHVTAAARFINDPNGPVYANGAYHVFFQHLPFWGADREWTRPFWGHAVSVDLIHWRHKPVALAPTPGSYDEDGIASGGCVIDGETPTIIYTGVANGRQTQCIATSRDGLDTWQKDPANPVIPDRPSLEGLEEGFRDPCVWREGNEWRLLAGSGITGKGGAVLLYRSPDLRHWEFLGPLCTGFGERCFQWECPAFFPLGGRQVLIVSPLYHDAPGLRGRVDYAVGAYKENRFFPDAWRPVDLGGPTVYYAPSSFADAKGRRILWGWIMADRPAEAGWCHCLSLPRILSLADDGTLRYAPAPELAALRKNPRVQKNITPAPGADFPIATDNSLHGELQVQIEPGAADRIELRMDSGAGEPRRFAIAWDKAAQKIYFGDKQADFTWRPEEKLWNIRFFFDGCIGELYLNDRECFSNILPFAGDRMNLSLRADGAETRINEVTLWDMNSIWEE